MEYATPGIKLQPVAGAMPVRAGAADAAQLHDACANVRSAGGALVALWGSDQRARGAGFAVQVALQDEDGLVVLTTALDAAEPEYPDLSQVFPSASRMQRAARDLVGVRAKDGDGRPWLRHNAWPATAHPL